MRTLSTGDSSTLGNYKKLAELFMGEKANAFLQKKIDSSPNGADEEVIGDE